MESPAVWFPRSLLFLAPFVDPARPARILHLDLLVLLCFGGLRRTRPPRTPPPSRSTSR